MLSANHSPVLASLDQIKRPPHAPATPAPSKDCADRVRIPRPSPGLTLFPEVADDDQQDHGADDGVDDGRQNASDQDEADHRQQPAGNDGADDADHAIADQPKAIALDDLPGEPTRNRPDDEPNDE